MNNRDAEFLKLLIEAAQEPQYEVHADGVKEICPFCPPKDPCNEPHCPYTEEE